MHYNVEFEKLLRDFWNLVCLMQKVGTVWKIATLQNQISLK